MSKYSDKFKLEVVKYCVNEHHGYKDAAKHFNIPSPSDIRKWVRRYNEHGIEGLKRNINSNYSGEFKVNVIEYMHKNHLSLQETSYHFRLGTHSIVGKWERIYNEKGPKALYERHGKINNMNFKSRNKKINKTKEELIAENQRLRMENEYLKKLNALVQERIKREDKKK